MMRVDAAGVVVDIDGVRIVSAGVLRAEPGTMVGLVGPNGSGKSTFLRTLYRVLRPSAGLVTVDGDDVWGLSARQSAQRTAVLTQDGPADFDFSVREIISLGRVPHKGALERSDISDEYAIDTAIAHAGVSNFADRAFNTLSGGERQRVLLARALAQEPRVLVLDEPTNHLDIAAQLELLELVTGLDMTVVAALHDLNLAATYCDQVFVLDDGRVVASGSPEDVLTPQVVLDVFGVAAHCGVHPLTGRRLIAFSPSASSHRLPAVFGTTNIQEPS